MSHTADPHGPAFFIKCIYGSARFFIQMWETRRRLDIDDVFLYTKQNS